MLAVPRIDRLDARELHDVRADAEDHPRPPRDPGRDRRASSISAFISRTAAAMPVEDRARDDRVPDVELDDLVDRRDRLHVVIVQAVPGVHGEPERARRCRAASAMRASSRARRSPVASA